MIHKVEPDPHQNAFFDILFVKLTLLYFDELLYLFYYVNYNSFSAPESWNHKQANKLDIF